MAKPADFKTLIFESVTAYINTGNTNISRFLLNVNYRLYFNNKAVRKIKKYSALKSRTVAELKRREMTYRDLARVLGYQESTIKRFMADNIAGKCNSTRVAAAIETWLSALKGSRKGVKNDTVQDTEHAS